MAILVTGAAGFIGSHLLQFLLSATPELLVGIDDFNDYYDPEIKRANARLFQGNPRVRMVEADFCDSVAVDALFREFKFRQVIHLGAYAGVRASVERPTLYEKVNVGGTLTLLEAARRRPVQRFLLASSSTVYGYHAQIPFREDAPLGIPLSPYGVTKRAAELMGLTYHQLHGVPVVCLRPFSVYGPRLRPDLALTLFTQAIYRGTPLTLFGDGSIRRDFTHVTDICRGIVAALDAAHIEGQTINLGHSVPVEMRYLIGLIAESLGKQANIDFLPPRSEDLPVTFADLEKARQLLGYEPKVPLEQGIHEYCAWFRDQASRP